MALLGAALRIYLWKLVVSGTTLLDEVILSFCWDFLLACVYVIMMSMVLFCGRQKVNTDYKN